MKSGAGQIEGLIESIYEAAVAPDRWSSALRHIGQAIGTTSGTALWFDGKGIGLLHAATWDLEPESVAAYARHYVTFCPRLRLSRRFDAGQSYDDRSVRLRPSPTDREYYEFTDRLGCGLARTVLGERNEQLRMGLNFYGPIHGDSLEPDHRLLRALAPHLRRAAHLTMRIAELGDRAEFGEQLFEMSSVMLLVGEGGRVIRMNARAEAALAPSDGLSVARGHLQAARPTEDDRLRREIAAALGAGPAPLAQGFALVSRPSGLPAWAVSAAALPRRNGFAGSPVPLRALVTVAETVPRVSPARLRQGFGLSVAEAEIAAALTGGRTLDEIALSRKASLQTVRAQFKSIFAKLEVANQAQLVGRVAAVAGLPGSPRST